MVRPHPDVASGDLAMGTYAANLAAVALGGGAEPCTAMPSEFFAATYFTPTMRELLRDVFGALAGEAGDRVVQLRTPFGGGKTHSLLALYHLAHTATRLPGIAGARRTSPIRARFGSRCSPASTSTRQRGREVDGRTIRTLWGELAYQLGGWPAYDEHRSSTARRAAARR